MVSATAEMNAASVALSTSIGCGSLADGVAGAATGACT